MTKVDIKIKLNQIIKDEIKIKYIVIKSLIIKFHHLFFPKRYSD
jgi:hypothetical protein